MVGAHAAEMRRFLDRAEAELFDLSVEAIRADWVYQTFITPDSEAVSSRTFSRLIEATARLAREASAFPWSEAPASERRKVDLLRRTVPLLAPSDPKRAEELTRTVAAMQGAYARGRHALPGENEPSDLQQLSELLRQSRDPSLLEDAWSGWHRVGRSVRPDFERYVKLANQGARELEYADTGAYWRSKYDMDPAAFGREVERLWQQVQPLYRALHAYVRRRLVATDGSDRVPERGPIPAHLLGNMWAQSWDGIYPLVAPPSSSKGIDLTETLVARGTSATDLVRYGERFFTSLGFEPLPATFWDRSLFSRPRDREVDCHASAWDLDFVDDLRIKMCVEVTDTDFYTVHHELGHNYYQWACSRQPFLFRDSAHDGFHEAVGDTIALSVTPEYLGRIGLLPAESDPSPEDDLGFLLRRALEKVAFLPFGLSVDTWRWDVFSGVITPAEYNRSWWELRGRYQGIAPPHERSPSEFDPGAKYHVTANVPYIRYFLAHILQFQFHRALTREAGAGGPMHRRSIYGSAAAGRRLRAMLEMGQSREWPDALEAVTGERRMDAGALLEYFAPLQRWLERENASVPIGW